MPNDIGIQALGDNTYDARPTAQVQATAQRPDRSPTHNR
jgi:hypothetical protein